MSNIDKLLYIDGLGEITQNLNIGGNINLANGTLSVDTISEKTNANGVTIDSVLLKDGNITGELIGNADTATAIATIGYDNGKYLKSTSNGYTWTTPYTGIPPIAVNNTTNQISYDLFNLSEYTSAIGNESTFFISENGYNTTFRKFKFSNLKTSLINENFVTTSYLNSQGYVDTSYLNSQNYVNTSYLIGQNYVDTSYLNSQNYVRYSSLYSQILSLNFAQQSWVTQQINNSGGSGGGSSVWSQYGSNAYYTSGYVGIGVSNPVVGLHIKGNGHTANRVQIESSDSSNPVLQFKTSTGSMAYIYYTGSVIEHSPAFSNVSDDRIKENETLISNSINTILKLRPQTYIKKLGIMSINEINNNTESTFEAGLIAQEIYYEVPELRHLVSVPSDAILIDDNKYRNFTDIKNDPDYNNWGNNIASVNYTGLIPYLIKGIQEQQEEINTLKQENIELKSIIDKLKTANSFEEFKNLL